jgi:hypothetical protein
MQSSKKGTVASRSGSFKNGQEWGKKCFEDLDQPRMGRPATRTWSTDFLLREGSSREEIGKWSKKKSVLFLQAHRETEAHFTAAGMSSQRNQSDSFRFKRAAFYNGLKSKVGLAAAKAAALRVNLNVQGCGIVAPPMHASSRTPLLLPLLLSHNLPTPRVH